MVKAQNLKFGMDRILSENASFSRKQTGERRFSVEPLCSGCTSPWYRCCWTSKISQTADIYRNEMCLSNSSGPWKQASEVDSRLSKPSNPKSLKEKMTKRKRSWSRAVFSNLQRKGLEKRFQIQKYITKLDRRQLAATLGLTDAQVKVWFQNRRMKWRHSNELSNSYARIREKNVDFSQKQNNDCKS